MGISFPSDIQEFNETDFDILRCTYYSNCLWKMEITRKINEQRTNSEMVIERSESISKQAVSRRVENLHKLGYLDSSIISLNEVESEKKPERDFIEGYRISDKGKDVLEEITVHVLKDVISTEIVSDKQNSIKADKFLDLYSEIKGKDVNSLKDFFESEAS